MNCQVNLLVCLSAQHPFICLSELHFYHLVNAIVPVINVQLTKSNTQLHALVKVQDLPSAHFAIAKLNGAQTTLGTIRVALAGKTHTCFADGTAHPGHQSEFGAKTNHFKTQNSTQNLFNSNYLSNSMLNNTMLTNNVEFSANQAALKNNKENKPPKRGLALKPSKNQDCSEEVVVSDKIKNITTDFKSTAEFSNSQTENRIHITHDDVAQLSEKKVLKAFRRFGRVFGLHFIEEQSTWVLEYGSIKEVSKVTKVLNNNKLFGYRLRNGLHTVSQSTKATTPVNISTPSVRKETPSNKHSTDLSDNNTSLASRSTLRIDLTNSTMSIEKLCLIVARIHKPVQMSLGLDSDRKSRFCFAEFNFLHQAAEVLVALDGTVSRLRCRFVN